MGQIEIHKDPIINNGNMHSLLVSLRFSRGHFRVISETCVIHVSNVGFYLYM